MKFSVSHAVFAIVLCLTVSAATAASISGKVVGVSDGDTVTVLDASNVQHKIRLEGIDAPEKAQAFGQRSKENLSRWVFGRQVVVETSKNDKYGGAVGKVMVNGVDANLEQVKAGFAWHYKQYAREQSRADRASYARAEDSARSSMLGLWRDANPMPPWEWRHVGKNVPTVVSLASGCPCHAAAICIGKRGGHYCVAPNGKKRYY